MSALPPIADIRRGIKQLERRHSPRIRSCFQQRQRGCGKPKGEIAISAHLKPRSGGVLFCCHTRIVRRRDACLIELGDWLAIGRTRKDQKNRHPTSSEQGRCWSQTKNVPRNLRSLWRGFFFQPPGQMRAPLELTARGVVAEPRPVARRPVCSTRPEFRPLVPARHGVYAEFWDRFAMLVEPVMLPPGRLRLVTRPLRPDRFPTRKQPV